jgi:hypothetical protein
VSSKLCVRLFLLQRTLILFLGAEEGQATVETLGSATQYLHQVTSASVEAEELDNGNGNGKY